ncbi:MAG: hypothetical protein AAGF11_10310 [Myxococcota bacterium]
MCIDLTDLLECINVDQDACICAGCNEDGMCGNDDDCVCADCSAEPACTDPGNCTDDGLCFPYDEGCQCADCMGHPECAG